MANTCPICVKLVRDSDEGVGCDGVCGRWFHRECLRMPKTEYHKLSGNNKWNCMRTDCIAPAQQPLSQISVQIGTVLSKLDDLLAKVDKIDEISADILGIKSQIAVINTSLTALEPRINNIEDKVIAVESDIADFKEQIDSNAAKIRLLESRSEPSDAGLEDVIAEMKERSLRSKNVMVFGLPESSKAKVEERAAVDRNAIQELFSFIESDFDVKLYKSFRVGKLRNDKPRPMKVILDSEAHVVKLLKASSNIVMEDISADLTNVRLSRDRTKKQIEHLDALRVELASRQRAGGTELTIKFVNGLPKIVPKNM